MILPLASLLIILAALGLQLAMVVGVIGPSLLLAFLGYAGLFAGMLIVVPAAVRRARVDSETRRGRSHDG